MAEPMPQAAGPRPLAELLERWRAEGRLGSAATAIDTKITGVRDDSRAVEPGDLFVAVKGLRVDGHDFVAQAIERGAAAVAVERSVGESPVPQLIVDRGAASLASAAAWWYGDPSRHLLTLGVTGTNGKTTTSFLVAAGLAGAQFATGLIGTIGIRVGGHFVPNDEPNTTPGALTLQRILREMVDAGAEAVVIETSSHGLAADRVASVDYDGAIFTNLSHEHLDFHGTFDAYQWAKVSLFERLPQHAKGGRPGVGVVNADDPHANAFIDATRGAKALPVTYGERPEADVRLKGLSVEASGTHVKVQVAGKARKLNLRLPGRFNAYNAMAVLGLAHGWGLDLDAVSAALEAVTRGPRPHGTRRSRPAIHGRDRLRPYLRVARRGAARAPGDDEARQRGDHRRRRLGRA